ncbi:response regulator [Rubripirellula reticaptiva]|uniref:Hydrogenase transcriptional regulatory protein hupR1 n=1 Tax=Rubripirellula reticaptiva TaxID=2528013 RepID=A0A5C6EGK8_9BACT|nr:response regulator [Rubripirellula reticaptiva]TWU47670.1 Hydrogenase transcriptional regulatory protein hupR1 [Rubripirellula reticaptiva]
MNMLHSIATTEVKTSILFVDDEVNVLSGLRRMLRGQRGVWDMHFAGGGQEALDLLATQPVDVIVSDMRMPGIDGAELLTRVSKQYPHTIRLVLSGQSEHEKIFRAIGPAHQFMSKPCEPDLLIKTVQRACGLQHQLHDEKLQQITSKIDSLPSLPRVYRELVQELESDDTSLDRVADVIGSDLAMSAKVLQLVNSSFFGLPHHVESPKHAVSMLGLNIIRPLALSASAFGEFKDPNLAGFSLEDSVNHGLAVAIAARKIAQQETSDIEVVDDAFIAGMMHDIGKMILAVHLTDPYRLAIAMAEKESIPLWQAELSVFGTTHAAVGAHLLGLWGLPNPIVEAVAFHHQPSATNIECTEFSPVAAVHAANAICGQGCDKFPGANCSVDGLCLDREYLSSLGRMDKVAGWIDLLRPEAVS